MKLDFNPKKNITNFDYILNRNLPNRKILDFLVVKGIVKNWQEVLFFRLGIKKPKFTMKLRNGKKIKINEPEDYFEFWDGYEGQIALFKQKKLDEFIIIDKTKKEVIVKFIGKKYTLLMTLIYN